MLKKIDLFSPYIISISILVFLIIGFIGSFNYRFDTPLSNETIFIILYSVLIFSLAVFLTSRFISYNKSNEEKFPKIKNIIDRILNEKLLIILVLLSLVFQLINLYYIGGIPLFSSVLKSNVTTNLWRVSYILFLLSINILIAKYYKKKYFLLILIGLLLFSLNGYRTSIMGILISLFINFYYLKKINLKILLVFIILIIGLGLGIGFISSRSIENQHWVLNPLELIVYRAGFTLKVFDKIVPLAGNTNGDVLSLIFSTGSPRSFIGEYVLGYKSLITSTLFGPVYLDFGILGLSIQMLFFGIFLKIVHIISKNVKKISVGIYSILIAHTLIWIETGPTDIMIWFFFIIGLLIIILNIDKIKIKI